MHFKDFISFGIILFLYHLTTRSLTCALHSVQGHWPFPKDHIMEVFFVCITILHVFSISVLSALILLHLTVTSSFSEKRLGKFRKFSSIFFFLFYEEYVMYAVLSIIQNYAFFFLDQVVVSCMITKWDLTSYIQTFVIWQGYAYILTHPGIPTVFYDHFYDWGNSIRDQIVKLVISTKKIHTFLCFMKEPLTNLHWNCRLMFASVMVFKVDQVWGLWRPDMISILQ